MAEFVRRKRFFKYNDAQCKKFLSKDFRKRCAYCKIREGDLAGPDSFEKDHFFPIKKGGEDKYENLFYACTSCNGKSGKSDKWSETLLNPCKDKIWNVHVSVNDKFKCENLTPQGDEYIKTFKLNRKSYVKLRRTIFEHQKELKEKIETYKRLCQELVESGSAKGVEQILLNDIYDSERILEEGANYRKFENAFCEDIDELICTELSKAGTLEYVDRDYDLLYELSTNNGKYLCHIEICDINFGMDGKAKKYIATEKLRAWESINQQEKILIVLFNNIDQNVYYVELNELLALPGRYNEDRCLYYVLKEKEISKLNLVKELI